MNYLKRIMNIFLILIILVVNFSLSIEIVEAKTLRDLKNELSLKQQEYENIKNEQKLTEQEIQNKKNSINVINDEISNIQQEMLNLTLEIDTLTMEIEQKEQEIKDIMNYYQLSNGESAYLEYVFEAADFTDFIYRMAISEQLSDYNDKLIDEHNRKIEENEKKKVELSEKTVTLQAKQKSLESELKTLGSQLSEVLEENVSVEDEINSLEELIDTYENKFNCGLDEDLSICGVNKLPPDTKFYRPLLSGWVTANYGWYYPWGKKTWHHGMDFGAPHGTDVYSVAAGKVAYITYKASCGGNMVYIQHNINGQTYTTGYFHLATVRVDIGDVVTSNSIIGTVGGSPWIETWDSCSTGAHLHFQMAYGLIVTDYPGYTGFTANSFNPRLALNVPGEGGYFSNRIIKY